MSDDEGREKPHGASPAQEPSNPWSAPAEPGAPQAEQPYGDQSFEQQHYEQQPYQQPYGESAPPPPPFGSPEGLGGTPPYAPPPAPYGAQSQPPTYGPPPTYGAPPAYGGPGYGAPAGYGYTGPRTSNNATVVLVCGIASVVLLFTCGLGFIPAIVALVRAGSARREILASQGQLTGLGMVTAGRITAWCTIGLTILGIIAIVLLISLGVAFDSSSSDGGFSASVR